MVVSLPEPVDAVVLDPAVELTLEPGDVVVAQEPAKVAIAVERRIADDDACPGPRDAQCVTGPDAGQVAERQCRLVEVQFVDRELVAHPERHTGERDREGVDLDPLDVRQREEGCERALLRSAPALRAPQLALPLVQPALEAAQLPVGGVQEVARAAGGVENHVVEEVLLKRLDLREGVRCFDALSPGVDDRRLDDLLDVDLMGVMRAQRVLRVPAERALQERAEDVRLDLAPVVVAREAQGEQLVGLEVELGRLVEQPALT